MRRVACSGLIGLYLLVPAVTSASVWKALVPPDCDVQGGCQSICDLAQLIQNIINDGIILATFLAAVLFAWAGFRMLTAGGDAHQIASAKKVFSAVFVGFLIVLSAWLIVDTIMKTLLSNGSQLGPWNEICQ